MRRQEFEIDNMEETEQFLQEMSFGFLATVLEDGSPSVTPLNYVYTNGAIYFHGSRIGQKMTSLSADPRVSFSVAKEFAIIPSYFSDPLLACPATAYFKSVLVTGKAAIVEDLAEKAQVLQAMMTKLQPEGGHQPIKADAKEYRGRLKGVAVVRIDPTSITGKFKFGQNLTADKREPVEEGLYKRGLEHDAETIELMRKYCPHHQSQSNSQQ